MTGLSYFTSNVGQFRKHPLGFFYLHMPVTNDEGVRCHIWLDPPFNWKVNRAHQHSFDIASTILVGAARSSVYLFVPGAADTHEFSVSYDGISSSLQSTGRTGNLNEICAFDSNTGDTYSLSAGTIHRFEVLKCPCVTVVKYTERHVPIFSYGSQVDEAYFDRAMIGEGDIARVLEVLNNINSSRTP